MTTRNASNTYSRWIVQSILHTGKFLICKGVTCTWYGLSRLCSESFMEGIKFWKIIKHGQNVKVLKCQKNWNCSLILTSNFFSEFGGGFYKEWIEGIPIEWENVIFFYFFIWIFGLIKCNETKYTVFHLFFLNAEPSIVKITIHNI